MRYPLVAEVKYGVRHRIAVLVALGVAGCFGGSAPRPLTPRPTVHLLDEGAEHENKVGRERWIEEIHRAAPGVDWRAIEARNRRAETERRRRLALSGSEAATPVWHEVGSRNLAGRMMCGALGTGGTALYAGSALGGVWRSDPSGQSWTPLSDDVYGGVNDMVVVPGENPGDPDLLACAFSTNDLWVTRDGGATWEMPAIAGLTSVRRMAVLQDLVPTILVCGISGSRTGVWGSVDYGRTFQLRYLSAWSFQGSMFVPREGPGAQTDVYLLDRGQLRKSTDGGFSFPLVSTIDMSASRGVLAGSEAGAPTLYAATDGSGWELWRSDDAGQTFAPLGALGDFWEEMNASRRDPNVVIYGGVEAFRSTDGGQTFALVNPWGDYYGDPVTKLHADTMGLYVERDPADPTAEIWYDCTDGGIYESRDQGASWLNLSLTGLGVSQYYSVHTSAADPTLLVAGAQDQGYQRGFVQPPAPAGPSSNFTQLISGDYAHIVSGDGTHQLVYSVYPGFILIQEGELAPKLYTANFPPGAPAPWLPVLLADPLDNDVFYFGSDRLYLYDRVPGTNTWTPTLYSSQDFSVAGGGYITAMAFAPTDPLRMYAVNGSGRLFVSRDHGFSWTQTASGAPNDHYLYGQAIAVHPSDPDEVVVGGSGYSTPGVIRSTDGGQTWQPLGSGLPQTQFYALTYDPSGSGDVYAATDSGAYRWNRQADAWENVMLDQAPLTTYWDVESVPPNLVRFATYGRGVWDYAVSQPGGVYAYGSGKLNSLGSATLLDASGTPDLSTNDFALEGTLGVPLKPGLVIWSTGPAQIPFQGGTLWLAPPLARDVSFQWAPDFTAHVPIPIDPTMVGQDRYYQLWYRDPAHPDGYGVGLSSALRVSFGP